MDSGNDVARDETVSPLDTPPPAGRSPLLSRLRKLTLGLLWITYAAHYLCRVNLAASQKTLSADLGFSKQQLGSLVSLLKIFYCSGQFINGHLADRLSPRRLIIVGLTASGILNLLFAHQSRFSAFAVLWALNGYFQAFGWTAIVRLATNWFPPRLREMASGVLGTSYVLGYGFSNLLSGHVTQLYGWRYAFWTPAFICFGVVGLVVLLVRDEPPGGAEGNSDEKPGACAAPDAAARAAEPGGLFVPGRRGALLLLLTAQMCLLFGYHGLLDWTPHYLAEVSRNVSAGAAADRSFLLPLGGALGCMLLAVLARRSPGKLGLGKTILAPLVGLFLLMLVYPLLPQRAPQALPGGLLLIGAVSSPPASVMACALPADLCGAEVAGRAAGLVDASGYVGSALSGWLSGKVMDHVAARQGPAAAWRVVWRMWAGGVLVAVAVVWVIIRRLKRGS